MGRVSTRQDDEILLKLIAERASGRSSYDIAAEYGVTANALRTKTNRVRDDDSAMSGEDVSGAYWG
jgi:hypothetical protein